MVRFVKIAVVMIGMTATSAYAAAPVALTGAVASACCALGVCCGMPCCG